jgi:phosphinothricin acetyltransferase
MRDDLIDAAPGLRRATAADWQRISALLSASSLPLDGARDHLDGFVVAESSNEFVGCAAIERYGDVGLLRSVAVSPSVRGRGVGVALVERCIAEASEIGLTSLVLLTTTAERFFPRFGFAAVDRASVPDAVRASAEFTGACPASAIVMMRSVSARSRANVTVRVARVGDSGAIADIYNAGIRDRVATFETRERTLEDVESWFSDTRHPMLVAERDGTIVGWTRASSYCQRDCYAGIAEFSVYVAPTERGRRVGDALLAALIPALNGSGFWKVLSRIFVENGASRALCRRHGFREVGVYERHAKLDGVWRDVVIVERLLGEAESR